MQVFATQADYITAIVFSGIFGLVFWFIAITDNLYRLGLPRTRRSATYDRIGNYCIAIGSLFIGAFVLGLYSLIP